MARYLSPQWMDVFAAALRDVSTDSGIVVQQRITDAPEGTVSFHVILGPDGGTVAPGEADAATVAFGQDYATACAIASGELTAEEAFIRGRLTLDGDPRALIEHRRALSRLGDVFAGLRAETSY